MSDYFKDHVLTPVLEAGNVEVWRMAKPGTVIHSVQLSFTPAGTAIQGDCCVRHNGVCSDNGNYGLRWFIGELSPDYLCAKFLEKKWVPDLAEEALREALNDPEHWLAIAEGAEDYDADLREGVLHLIDANEGFHEHEVYEVIGHIDEWHVIGWDYVPSEARTLVDIQRKFRELWWEREIAKSYQKREGK